LPNASRDFCILFISIILRGEDAILFDDISEKKDKDIDD
jgi:hypothetical protein